MREEHNRKTNNLINDLTKQNIECVIKIIAHDEMFVFKSLYINTHDLITNMFNKFCDKLLLRYCNV